MLSGRAVEASPADAEAPAPGPRRTAWIAAMLLVVAAAAGAAGWYLKPPGATLPLRKALLIIEDLDAGYRQPPALSPDGRRIVYSSNGRLWIRDLDQLDARELPGAEEGRSPFWSPDSTQVAFGAKGKIWRSAVSGGQALVVCDQKGDYDGGAWTADGTIVFVPRTGPMYKVPALGGDPEVLLELDVERESDFHKPHALPGGRGLLFAVHRTEGTDTLAVLADGKRKVLLQLKGQRLDHPAYSPSGHLLYRRTGTNSGVWAVPFSLSRLEMSGEPFLIAPGGDVPTVAYDGTLAFVQSDRFGLRQLVRVDRSGRIIEPIGQPQNLLAFPSVSPDGHRVAVAAFEAENLDIWIHDVVRGTRTRLTFDPLDENPSAWRPGSDQVAFWRAGKGIWVKRSDGTGEESQIAELGANPSFTPDGRMMIYHQRPRGPGDLMTKAAEGGQKPAVFLSTDANEADPAISPDGRYVAYESDDSGRDEVYLKQFPGGEGKWQVSVAGGRWPVWSRQGKELYYQGEDDALFAVAVEERPTLTLGNPRKLFGADEAGVHLGGARFYDVAPDGTFVMIQSIKGSGVHEGITLVQNWFAEFSARK
jgi:Tol biopolymer transport system component